MLSQQEYVDTKWKLKNVPSSITGQTRQNYRQMLKKKLKEHKYASMYPPFEPLPHFIYHINHITPDVILNQIIQMATTSNLFTLDTESINIYKSKNKPVLIQIQVLLPHNSSVVLIFEMMHLPPEHAFSFTLIKKIFEIILNHNKTIYIWGKIQELISFTIYTLFSETQCYLPNVKNLQDIFKQEWQQTHPHVPSNELVNKCLCEECINISPSNPWGLQDAIAFQLHEWLDKRHSTSSFHIGLDTNLFPMNEREQQHRHQLTRYAADDCLSMQRILISLNLIQLNYYNSSTRTVTTSISSTISNNHHINIEVRCMSDEDDLPIIQQSIHETNTFISNDKSSPTNNETGIQQSTKVTSTTSTSNKETNNDQTNKLELNSNHFSNNHHQQINVLSKEERKRIHNRTCTKKQRKKNFQHEIIIRNIDRRFPIKKIKKILRQRSIEFSGVNTSKSSRPDRKHLYIGIKNKHLLSEYEQQIKYLFTTAHYNQLNRSSYTDDRYIHRRHQHRTK
ncbi:unnamed protein product [Rotaria sp. Silwood1]|nr:unnamed protein product [Rotaria sp. Silwood1]